MCYRTETKTIVWFVVSIGKIHGSGNLEMEVGVVLLLFTFSIPLGEFVLPIPATLGSVGLEVLVLR